MLNLKMLTVLEKNRLVSMRPQLLLLDIAWDPVNDPSDVDRLVVDNQPFTFMGNEYTPFPIQLKENTRKTGGELSTCTLMVSNVNRAVESEISQWDGAVDAEVTIYGVNADAPDGDPELVQVFAVLTTSTAEDWATFNLGMQNPTRQQFPLRTYMQNRCWKQYNNPALQAACDPLGASCGYEGDMPTCSRTAEGPNGCRAHDNISNFGGYLGINVTGYKRAFE